MTIQPHGAKFDPPAELTLPNVDGHLPGAEVEMYSYDHDLEEFVTIGLGTVSKDGSLIQSNAGVGVIKAGWHCGSGPGGSGCCDGGGGGGCGYCADKVGSCPSSCKTNTSRQLQTQIPNDCKTAYCGGRTEAANDPKEDNPNDCQEPICIGTSHSTENDDTEKPEDYPCKKCNGGNPETDVGENGFECGDDECKKCENGVCKKLSVTIDQIQGTMCEGEVKEIGGSYNPNNGKDSQAVWLGWTTDTPGTVGVIGKIVDKKGRATITAGAGFGEAKVTAFYKERGLCSEDTTTFEVLPKKVDGRIGGFSEQYDFLQAKCTPNLHDSNVDHPIDGCSAGIEGVVKRIQDINHPAVQATFGIFSLYQKDSEHDFPIWGEFIGNIPDSDPRTKTQTLACNKHDICYQTCGSLRSNCDKDLGSDARNECDNHYPSQCPSTVPDILCPKYHKERFDCKAAVTFMYDGVVGVAGNSAFTERQAQHCFCCEPRP